MYTQCDRSDYFRVLDYLDSNVDNLTMVDTRKGGDVVWAYVGRRGGYKMKYFIATAIADHLNIVAVTQQAEDDYKIKIRNIDTEREVEAALKQAAISTNRRINRTVISSHINLNDIGL